MSEKVSFRSKDILSGKVNPDGIQSRYVAIWTYEGISNKLYSAIEAANLMAKFGWRVVGVGNSYLLLEREA
ncbi:MAG: hypothetical protein ACFFCH_08160 [Promethearchaeota archaeon]